MEIEHEEPRREGFFFDVQTFRLDLYRLLCCFYSSADFAKKRGRLDGEELGVLGGQFEEFEVMRLLVNVASTVRVVSDREKSFFRQLKLKCGVLLPNAAKPAQQQPLSLREACNKILHTSKFNFDARALRVKDNDFVNTQHALKPFVHLYGTKDGVEWKATLNIEEFVRYNARVIQG